MKSSVPISGAATIRKRGFVAALIGALVAAFALLAAPALPASAATIPATTAVFTSPPDPATSAPTRTVTAHCPSDKPRVLGGGFRLTGGAGHVLITQEEPRLVNGGDLFVVSAIEDAVGTNATWSLEATAVCSPATISGLTITSKVGSPQSANFGNATTTCPGGTNALSAGGRIDGGGNRVALSTKVEGGVTFSNQTTAAGMSRNGGPTNWSVTAYTVCAPLNGILDATMVPVQVNTGTSVTATCPAPKHVTGGSVWSDVDFVTALDVNAARSRVIGETNTNGVKAVAICI